MTELQKIRALGLKGCRLAKGGSREIDFVATMNHIADKQRNRWLTTAQADWLEKMTWKYREQLQTNGFGHAVPSQSPYEDNGPLELITVAQKS